MNHLGGPYIMKKILFTVFSISLAIVFAFNLAITVRAADRTDEILPGAPMSRLQYSVGKANDPTTGEGETDGALTDTVIAPANVLIGGLTDKEGNVLKTGLLPTQAHYLALMYKKQPSSSEYFADLLDNIGIPTVSRAYAQGTGYSAMSTFLPFWKVFRNLAYSLYIIMFVIVGIMIMLRTKVNAQTIISIQTALPNLLITLILITFSYAIVGFMIDIMYFLIYFVVYLLSSIDIISTPTLAISRLLNHSAWSVIFEGRNSIISAVQMAITQTLSGLGTGALGLTGKAFSVLSWLGLGYLVAAVWLAVAMLKLMWVLINCYFMLLVQTITAPIQILMNAVPGSKAFSEWLKKTASYLLPFPIVACMFIFAAVLIGDPSRATILQGTSIYSKEDSNPFGINKNAPLYDNYGGKTQSGSVNTGTIWLPPFTLTEYSEEPASLMVLLGFFIITMTPAAAKMAMDWMQTKASPYVSEIGAGLQGGWGVAQLPIGYGKGIKAQAEQRKLMQAQAGWIGDQVYKGKSTEKPGT